jgi:hypothetical protein
MNAVRDVIEQNEGARKMDGCFLMTIRLKYCSSPLDTFYEVKTTLKK